MIQTSNQGPNLSMGEAALGGRQYVPSRVKGLIINADDWGRNRGTTDCTLDCIRCGSISSVSAMVFMEDSERAAEIACDHQVDPGLHLNFTLSFSRSDVPSSLVEHQRRLANYLLRRRLSQVVFHPGLMRSFEYVVSAQREEFARLYGKAARRLDGHHHMHLCTNVLLAGLLPSGTVVRRNFSFQPGEKSFSNRSYRRLSDWIVSKHHQSTDFFFSIQPLAPLSRLQRILELSRQYSVELETHPQDQSEYRFLMGGGIRDLADVEVATGYNIRSERV